MIIRTVKADGGVYPHAPLYAAREICILDATRSVKVKSQVRSDHVETNRSRILYVHLVYLIKIKLGPS